MTITKHIGSRSWTIVISLLLLLLLPSFVSSQQESDETYILCPLGQNIVTLVNDQANGMEWKILFDTNNHENQPQSHDDDDDDDNQHDYTSNSIKKNPKKIQVRPCWCITLNNQYPVFCPTRFDTCRVESGLTVTCINLVPEQSANWWPFLSPIAIVLTCTIVCFCCGTLRGQSCRDYITLLFYAILDGCTHHHHRRQQQRYYNQQLERIAQRMQQRNPSWIRTLLTSGIERELRHRSSPGDDNVDNSWILPPIRLELQTRIYHRPSMTNVHDNQSIQSEDDEENFMVKIENQQTIQVMDLQNGAEKNDVTIHPSLDNDLTSVTSDEDGELCVICFTNLKEGDRVGNISCNHLFHVNCLKEWLKKKNECPLCSATSIAVLKQ
jgi:Ring finger domain